MKRMALLSGKQKSTQLSQIYDKVIQSTKRSAPRIFYLFSSKERMLEEEEKIVDYFQSYGFGEVYYGSMQKNGAVVEAIKNIMKKVDVVCLDGGNTYNFFQDLKKA